ncbi:MAG: ComEC/Rec2 family competence protein [Acutalibacteraceae bacterium]
MTREKLAKKIATWIIMTIMLSVFALDIFSVVMCNKYQSKYDLSEAQFTFDGTADRIHFLNTRNSDAILIESNGKFALIDSGEGNHNPRRTVSYSGSEEAVIEYLKKAAGDKDGKVTLEFALATHNHYDHTGCFEAIANNSDIHVKTFYIKPVNREIAHDYECNNWGIEQTYEATVTAFLNSGTDVTSDIPSEPFKFGDFTLTFYNTALDDERLHDEGENAESVGLLIEKGEKSAFLASDITRTTGLEKILIPELRKVDLLKVGHHGYYGSTSWAFARKLDPEIAIVTNELGKIYPDVKWTLTTVSHSAIFGTFNENGIIAEFTDDGEIKLSNHAQG